jgi:hypothetical protein
MVSTTSTSHSGRIPSLAVATNPFIPSATALHSHMGCLVQVQVLYFPTPLHRLQVWGQGALTLLCMATWGELPLPLTLSLTGEVIYLLFPLRSVEHTSHPPGRLHTMVYLERGVKDHLCKICW